MPKPAQDAIAHALSYLVEDFDMVSGQPQGQLTREDIAALGPDVLLLEGARTRISARAIQDALSGLIPGARRRVIADAGHLSPVDAPEAVAAALRDFWGNLMKPA